MQGSPRVNPSGAVADAMLWEDPGSRQIVAKHLGKSLAPRTPLGELTALPRSPSWEWYVCHVTSYVILYRK